MTSTPFPHLIGFYTSIEIPCAGSKKRQLLLSFDAYKGRTTVCRRSPAPLRHMKGLVYRCFLPDLAGFTSLHCVRPDPRHTVVRPCKLHQIVIAINFNSYLQRSQGTLIGSAWPLLVRSPYIAYYQHRINLADFFYSQLCSYPRKGSIPCFFCHSGATSLRLPIVVMSKIWAYNISNSPHFHPLPGNLATS